MPHRRYQVSKPRQNCQTNCSVHWMTSPRREATRLAVCHALRFPLENLASAIITFNTRQVLSVSSSAGPPRTSVGGSGCNLSRPEDSPSWMRRSYVHSPPNGSVCHVFILATELICTEL